MRAESLGEVLIVDDTPANLQLLTNLLKERGYKGRPVTSGALALRAAAARPPDLILLDINMPEMDGYEVCRRLKQDEALRDIPVLFISALSDSVDKVAAFRAGGVDFVTKPFDLAEVGVRVETHVRLRRAQLELEHQRKTLADNLEKLREMEQLRDTLAHMMAHDMRSPLTGLLGALTFLKEDLGDRVPEDSLKDLERGLHSVHQLVRMLNDLLDVSRLEANAMPIERVWCDVAELCRLALGSLHAHARGRNVDLSNIEPGARVLCDEQLMQRVLMNLLHNALKFTPKERAVTVRVERDAEGTRILVTDQGPGVPADAREKIFEKYEQARLRGERRVHGSGLGLAFCKLVMDAHHGSIGVSDESTGGSTFWVHIPLAAEASSASR